MHETAPFGRCHRPALLRVCPCSLNFSTSAYSPKHGLARTSANGLARLFANGLVDRLGNLNTTIAFNWNCQTYDETLLIIVIL